MHAQHDVRFYDGDRQAVETVTRYVEEGLARGERVVVIATAEHLRDLEHAAKPAAVVAEARATGQVVLLEATRALSAFMVDGLPDRDLFRLSVGGVIEDAGADGTPVRAFGEMVTLLWGEGNVAGALQLEELWNELAERHDFSLLCGYPTTALDAAPLRDAGDVCALHTDVHADYAAPAAVTGAGREVEAAVFAPVPQAVAAARRFVTHVLEAWERHELVGDAALVTSELATNAVRHAGSPFRTLVHRTPDRVRISVEDLAGTGEVAAGAPELADLNGRGVAIVAALARRWGCDPAQDGKVVWAELGAPAT